MRRVLLVSSSLVVCAAMLSAQPVFRGTDIFPPEEFAARRAKVFAAIADGVAVLQGTTERGGEVLHEVDLVDVPALDRVAHRLAGIAVFPGRPGALPVP